MRRISPFQIKFEPHAGYQRLHLPTDAAQSIGLSYIAHQYPNKVCILTTDSQQASRLEQELRYLCQHQGQSVRVLPDRETLPYDHFSPHQDIVSQRLDALKSLQASEADIYIVPITNALLRLTPRSFLHHYVFSLKIGQKYPLETAKQQLTASGYHCVQKVYSHGEYAVRGSIIDLFPMGTKTPYRIELFDDEIETIRTFDTETQRSIEKVHTLELLPAKEFPTDQRAIDTFRQNYRQKFERTSKSPESVYQQVSQGFMPAGIESYLPLFFKETETLFDYLEPDTLMITVGDLEHACTRHLKEVQQRYEQHHIDANRPLLPPQDLYLTTDAFFSALKVYPRSHLYLEPQGKVTSAAVEPLPTLKVNHQLKQPLSALTDYLSELSGPVVFCVSSKGRSEVLKDLLAQAQIKTQSLAHLEQWQQLEGYGLCIAPFLHGFHFPEENLTLICETDLLGKTIIAQRKSTRKSISADLMIRNLAELQIGQAIVHLEHGIGRYQGLEHLTHGDLDAEFLKLSYAQDDVLYVPISSLHLIHRYSGRDEEAIVLSRLGNKQWEKEKKKAAEKLTDVAAGLLDIYAQREAMEGKTLELDPIAYQQFAEQFPFEETPDQAQAIDAVIEDMKRQQPMDRLVCGDVGFGKTEVAMRAAFVAVHGGQQVALLVPTTLLAQQHYQNFLDRFAEWPVRIEVLSRFKTAKEQKQAIEKLHSGHIDIIIGTHKLLHPDLHFDDLGLLIVDEEHRFGVKHKEQIKTLRAQVNILTMTATPIPRTLNMAMSGIRDLSIIATPPAKRLSVKTFVRHKNSQVIKEALLRELLRGGQTYFLHNHIESIEKCAADLQELVPEARIVVAHGQMRERQLEQIMSDFYHQKFNVLVCSTIIETGIDIPTSNTIIIDRADKFGLAQLHQLRGRVGRSHHQAYAYLLTPHPKTITKDAAKRLEAISAFDDLGVGFLLATQDLEIRGAGDFLGDEQSGHMAKIGFSLYMDMLNEAVEALKEGKEPSLDTLLKQQCEIDLRIAALLPEDYIRDPQTRLSLYKRIASCTQSEEIDQIQVEMIDRFGLLPQAAKQLCFIANKKIKAEALGIKKIEMHAQGGSLEFREQNNLNPEFIIGLLQSQPTRYQMDGSAKLKFAIPTQDAAQRMQLLTDIVHQFEENTLGR